MSAECNRCPYNARRVDKLEQINKELLEACKEARKLYDELSMSNLKLACKYGDEYKPMGKEDCLEMRKALEQAIKKAEGSK